MDHRWGFEEADDVDERGEEPAAGELLTGADADGVVTVSVDDAANVRSVHLGAGWEDDAVRRGLGVKVVDAMTGATIRAMAKQAERIEPGAAEPAPASASKPPEQDSPLTTEDVMRLLHEVARDLGQFRQRLSAVVDETVTVASGGGHVTVSGRRQQVGDVSIDQDWLYRTRASEVESELRDALTAFRARSAPGELAPQSNAISELRSLVSDPQAMVRRIRQRNGSRR